MDISIADAPTTTTNSLDVSGGHNEDIDMEDDQDEASPLREPNEVVIESAAVEPAATNHAPPPPPPDFIYFFLKHFDTEQQSLTPICSRIIESNKKVVDTVQKAMADVSLPQMTPTSTWTIYKETGLQDVKQIDSHRTFKDENLTDGSILIAQITPTPEE